MAVLIKSPTPVLFGNCCLPPADFRIRRSVACASDSSSDFRAPNPAHSARIGRSGCWVTTRHTSPQAKRSPVFCQAGNAGYTEGEADGVQWDVSSNCVKPVFRVSPLILQEDDRDGEKVHILFLSEGNVCRSVYAEAIFTTLLTQHGLQDLVSCSSKATRDYNAGETADPRAVLVAEENGLELRKDKVATVFDCTIDIMKFDLIAVMDKFTAADALKEITVYEIVHKSGLYSSKVRRLGEFCQKVQIEDIDDPLYGNMGGTEELEFVREIYAQVRDSCEGLIEYILDIRANLQESESLKDGVARALGRLGALNWLAPPMLSKV